MFDLQKASLWKRLSAALLDGILLVTVAVGAVLLLSLLLGYDARVERLEEIYAIYESDYGVEFDLTQEEYEALDDAARERYDEASLAFSKDGEVSHLFELLFHLTILMIVFGILLAFLLLEFLVPLLLQNGQTVGKKVFGVGVMRTDGVKITPLLLFVRTVLGKYTVGTMLPVMLAVLLYFGVMGPIGLLPAAALLFAQVLLLFATPAHTPLHDKLAHTVTVDLSSQMIFETPEELLAYQTKYNESKE